MAVSYDIEGGRLTVRFVGHFGQDEVRATFRQAFQDPRATQGLRLLLDIRDSEQSTDPEAIERTIAGLARTKGLIAPCAAFVVSDDLHFAISRMASEMISRTGFLAHVTRDLDEGIRWLDAQTV